MSRFKSNLKKINTQGLESHILKTKSSEKVQTDKYLMLILGIIGFAGFYFVINSNHSSVNKTALISQPEPIEQLVSAANNLADTMEVQAINPILKTSVTGREYAGVKSPESGRKPFQVEGDKEAGEKLIFVIDSFDKNSFYRLEIDNDIALNLNNKYTYYTFDMPGEYHIKLKVFYDDNDDKKRRSVTLYDEPLFIFNAIETDESATKESFPQELNITKEQH